jgi:hypothetical protein
MVLSIPELEVVNMARFYDSIRDSELLRMENLLRRGGVEYSLQILDEEPRIKEINVAEEDMQAAERIVNDEAVLAE